MNNKKHYPEVISNVDFPQIENQQKIMLRLTMLLEFSQKLHSMENFVSTTLQVAKIFPPTRSQKPLREWRDARLCSLIPTQFEALGQ